MRNKFRQPLIVTLFFLLIMWLVPRVNGRQPLTYYVSAESGDDANSGLATNDAFATIQHAADQTQPGDTVLVMDGTYTVDNNDEAVVHITQNGTAVAWITYQAYPGHQPLIQNSGWWLTVWIEARYIVFDGFAVRGNNDDYNLQQATAIFNSYRTNGENPDVHPRAFSLGIVAGAYNIIRNNGVFKFGGTGISNDTNSDQIIIENNLVYENGWYSPFGESGISIFEPVNIDGSFIGLENTTYKIIIRNNISHSNYNFFPCFCANYARVTDGNGIILDSFDNADIPAPAYTAATLVANNIAFNNGGSGIHAFRVQRADMVNNFSFHNGRHPDLSIEMTATQSGPDVNIVNNIMVATPGENITASNGALETINFDYNIYFSEGADPLLGGTMGANDIIADPQLALSHFDLAFADWRPISGSPAIDSGSDGFLPLPDFYGQPRVAGAVNRGPTERIASKASVPRLPKAPQPLTIDGEEEAFWLGQPHHTLLRMVGGYPLPPSDLWAGYKAAWDDDYLYLFVYVEDDLAQNDSEMFWDDDSVELYLDIGNDKSGAYGADDYIYWFRVDELTFGEEVHGNTQGITYAVGDHGDAYTVEVRLPWTSLTTAVPSDTLLGLDVHVNDDDDGGEADNKLSWFAYQDSAWEDSSLLGTVSLSSPAPYQVQLPFIKRS